MGKISKPPPVKLISGLIAGRKNWLSEAKDSLVKEFGPVDQMSDIFSFHWTDYYQSTMGQNLMRQFLAFRELINPDRLPSIKIFTNQLEESFREKTSPPVARPVNIDPGYLAPAKLVLATTKNYSHRIYLKSGIYGEVTLKFEGDSFVPFPWTYPDYKSEEYINFFNRVRKKYVASL